LLHLDVARQDRLPPLAWLLHLSQQHASLLCGRSVVIGDNAFFEGAWAGPLIDWNFDTCSEVFGSGGKITSEGCLITPPSHLLEPVFLLQRQGEDWFASNSLSFLMSSGGERFVLPSNQLSSSLARIVKGIDESPIALPTTSGKLFLLYHHNCHLTPDGLEVRPKPVPASSHVATYASYVAYLQNVLRLVASNAAATGRSQLYRLLATLSSGYDSPACATLARNAGCDQAITFLRARGGARDDGTEIGKHLGLQVFPIDRPLHSRGPDVDEIEFLATGMQAEDLVYSAMSEYLRQRVLVTGFHGDKIWGLHNKPNSVIKRGDISGSSLGEFRLRRDFVHVPLPFCAAQRHADIARISHSEEMKAYSIGGNYDRPIPRRIAEEAGVPRELIGTGKKAVSLLCFIDKNLMSQQTTCTNREAAVKPPLNARLRRARYRLGLAATHQSNRLAGILPEPLQATYTAVYAQFFRCAFGYIPEIFEHTNPDMAIAFDNAFSEMSRRYAAAVTGKSISELGASSAVAPVAQTARSGFLGGSNA